MKNYDYIIPLGEPCHTTSALIELKLRKASFPFDWGRGNLIHICGLCGFQGKINMILRDFKNSFDEADLEEFSSNPQSTHRFVRNLYTGLQYIHEFPKDKTIHEHYPVFKDKYMRRAQRFNTVCKTSKVLYVFVAHSSILPLTLVRRAVSDLRRYFQNNNIDFLIINPNSDIEVHEYNYHQEDGIFSFEVNQKYFAPIHNADYGNYDMVKKCIRDFVNNEIIPCKVI